MGHTLPGGRQQVELCSHICCLTSLSMTWKRQHGVLSSSLQMTLNWGAAGTLKNRAVGM